MKGVPEAVRKQVTKRLPSNLQPYEWLGDPNVIERKDEVIPGLLGAGEVAVLTADTKVGKTQVATDMSFALSLGQTWYGRRLRTRKVFYCALEKHKVTRKRFRALQRLHHEVAPPIAISSAPVNLLDELCVDRLIAAVLDAGGVGLLVVDTFNRAAGGTDENSAGPMGTIFNNLTRIAEATGAAILILHHNSKNGDLRGSSAIPAGADVILTLVKEKDGARTLTLTQANDAIEGQTFRFRMNVVELSPATAVAPAETTVVIEPISDTDSSDARSSARSQSNTGDLRRADDVLRLFERMEVDGVVDRTMLLSEARDQEIVSPSNPASGSEQLRRALVKLRDADVLTFDAKSIWRPNAPTPMAQSPSKEGGLLGQLNWANGE